VPVTVPVTTIEVVGETDPVLVAVVVVGLPANDSIWTVPLAVTAL
jgi:hypothetical protein